MRDHPKEGDHGNPEPNRPDQRKLWRDPAALSVCSAPIVNVTEGDILADSGSLRVRRSRAHKAGDHSLCKRCAVLKLAEVPPDVPPVDDPRAEMRRLAARVVLAHERDPGNANLARETRMTLQALMGPGEAVDGDLAEMFAAFRR
jgi:hypothetical protein